MTRIVCVLFAIVVITLLLACSGLTIGAVLPTATDTPVPMTKTPTSTLTLTSTSSFAPLPTATFTFTITPSLTFTTTPSPTLTPTNIEYQSAFGIDYAHPELYLEQGEQSRISDPSVLDELRVDEQSIENLGDIYRWLKQEFEAYAAGGRTIGVVTVDQLLTERRLGGCHDHGLVYAAVARELGYPAIMARTVSIAWVEKFLAGEQGPHIGHVFVEVYLDGKWILIDSTNGYYLEQGYDPSDPVIPLKGPIAGSSEEIFGFYSERKGIDTWAFGIFNNRQSSKAMDELALQIDLASITYPDYEFQHFNR
jgi:hypothetical protein